MISFSGSLKIFLLSFDADNRLTTFNGSAVFFVPDSNMTSGPPVQTQIPTAYSYDARNHLTAEQAELKAIVDGTRAGIVVKSEAVATS